ncbi:MAG: hypothetical protein WCG10_05580 [Chlamydiota bacterium]
MTVSEELYLLDKPSLFEEHVDGAVERILDCKEDQSFWFLLVCLVQKLSVHPLVSFDLQRCEQEIKQQEEERNQANLKLLEEHWDKLWRYHRSVKHRKQLVRIKWMSMLWKVPMEKDKILPPYTITPLSAYQHAIFAIQEFVYESPFCRLMKKMSRLLQIVLMTGDLTSDVFETISTIEKPPRRIKISILKLAKKDKKINFHKRVFYRQTSIKKRVERIYLDLIVPPAMELHTPEERCRQLQSMAELSPAVCWSRMRFLERCYTAQELPFFKGIKGRWNVAREKLYQTALERGKALIALGAKVALRQSFDGAPSPMMQFLLQEYRIYRRDYERLLSLFKGYLHRQVDRMQQVETLPLAESSKVQPVVVSKPLTQPQIKSQEAIFFAKDFWDNNPKAQRNLAYKDYVQKSKFKNHYAYDTWMSHIQKSGVDPRARYEKVRGKAKKGK